MRLPARKQVKDLFEGLLGRDVGVDDAPPVLLDTKLRPSVAAYVDGHNKLSAVALMDFPLTAFAGAALGLVPKGGADVAIEESTMPTTLMENTAELFNVLAAPIGDASGVHQKLYATYAPHEIPPADITSWAAALGARMDVRLDIKGYGTGVLSVVSTLPA